MLEKSSCISFLFKLPCYVLLLPFEKPFKYYEKCFQVHLYIFLKRNLLVMKYKKRMYYKNNNNKKIIKKNLYFLISWKMAKLFLQKFNIMTDSSVFVLVFSMLLKIEEPLGELILFHLLQNVLTETSNICFNNH